MSGRGCAWTARARRIPRDDARPSGSIQSASSAAVARLRDVKKPENGKRHNRSRLLARFEFFASDFQKSQRLVGQAGQFGFVIVAVMRDRTVLVVIVATADPVATDPVATEPVVVDEPPYSSIRTPPT